MGARAFAAVAAVAVLAFSSIAPSGAQTPAPAPVEASAEAIAAAEARGALIYAYDRAASVSTDALLERWSQPGDYGVQGWIVEGDTEAQTVTFLGEGGAVAVFSVRDGEVVDRRFAARGAVLAPLTPAQQTLAGAVERAVPVITAQRLRPCTNAPFNTVVIAPEQADGDVLVYLLTAQTQQDVYPVGGHFLIRVPAEGEPQLERAFSRSCLNIPVSRNRSAIGMVVIHLLDPQPTELHVFSSLTLGLTVFVSTEANGVLWQVHDGRIRIAHQP